MAPDLGTHKLPPGTRELIKALAEKDWEFLAHLKASPAQIIEIDHFLQGFMIYQVGRLPKGRHAALVGI